MIRTDSCSRTGGTAEGPFFSPILTANRLLGDFAFQTNSVGEQVKPALAVPLNPNDRVPIPD